MSKYRHSQYIDPQKGQYIELSIIKIYAFDMYNTIKNEECEKLPEQSFKQYIDITEISRLAKNDPSLNASDGLHPSGKMYTMWLELIFPEVMKIIEG